MWVCGDQELRPRGPASYSVAWPPVHVQALPVAAHELWIAGHMREGEDMPLP